jgi:phosphohistidine phosphatase
VHLYIIRHAWAGHAGDPDWPDDDQRPLTKEGKARFAEVVRKLVKRGFAPQYIASSPLARCLQTAELVAAGTPGKPPLVPRDELRPGGDWRQLLRWTAQQASQCEELAWVGHAPDVGQMTAELIGAQSEAIDFAKGAVAALWFDEAPQPRGGELRWLVTAKLLGC